MKRCLIVAAIGLYVILGAAPARAHHAFAAMYDAQKPVRVHGVVAKVEWINPHMWIHIDVKRSDGNNESWTIEAANPSTLVGRGYTKDSIKIGTEVTVDGYQAKNGSLQLHARELRLPSGEPLILGSAGIGAPYDDASFSQDTARIVRTQVAGAWWTNSALTQRLGLTEDQKAKIERTFENYRLAIVSSSDLLEKEEAELERLLEAEPMDRNAVFTQIDRVIQARSGMERANAAMTVEMRQHLSRAQWLQLPRTNLTITTPAGGGRRGQ